MNLGYVRFLPLSLSLYPSEISKPMLSLSLHPSHPSHPSTIPSSSTSLNNLHPLSNSSIIPRTTHRFPSDPTFSHASGYTLGNHHHNPPPPYYLSSAIEYPRDRCIRKWERGCTSVFCQEENAKSNPQSSIPVFKSRKYRDFKKTDCRNETKREPSGYITRLPLRACLFYMTAYCQYIHTPNVRYSDNVKCLILEISK